MNRSLIAVAAGASLIACGAEPSAEIAPTPSTTSDLVEGLNGTQPEPTTTEPEPTTTEPPVTVTSAPPQRPVTTLRVLPTPTAPPVTMWPPDLPVDESNDAYRRRILDCIKSYEGDYTTETGNGHHGAYQFVQSTWDNAVANAGYPEWVGYAAGHAPPYVQDAAAWWLYQQLGFQPWPPASRYCTA